MSQTKAQDSRKRFTPLGIVFALAGLAFDTKFDFKVVVELPWTAQFFKVAPRAIYGQTPKLGTLHPSLMRAAKAAHDAAVSR